MARYFITGGAGFVGSHLLERLVGSGGVTVYDNLSSGKKEFIAQYLLREDISFTKADLLELDTLKDKMKGHSAVFHMAANPDIRMSTRDTGLDLRQGALVTYNVLEAMRVNGIKELVFASSSTVYGETQLMPIPEDYGPLQPVSLYGASKLASEGLITAFCHLFGMKAWIFRFANVVGKRATHGVVFDFINKLKQNNKELEILGDGTQQKPYIHVEDCVKGILYGYMHATEQVNVFNLGASSSTRVSDIARMLVKEMGLTDVEFKYTGGRKGWPGDVAQVRFDTSRMQQLGWKPHFTSDEAVSQAIKDMLV